MDATQMAQTVLRRGRQHGLTFRLEYTPDAVPTVHVSPKAKLTPWVTLAIPRCKAELVRLLDAEGHGFCTAADGTRWHQTLARCDTCGACDWGTLREEMDTWGQPMQVWGCLTCQADPAQLQRASEAGLADARWGGQQAPASHRAEQEDVHAAL